MEAARTLLEDIAQYFVGPASPRAKLDTLRSEQREAEGEIRNILDRLASKYGVPSDDVDEAIESIGLAIADLTYERESELLEELEVATKSGAALA
jgi:hypothetical protein